MTVSLVEVANPDVTVMSFVIVISVVRTVTLEIVDFVQIVESGMEQVPMVTVVDEVSVVGVSLSDLVFDEDSDSGCGNVEKLYSDESLVSSEDSGAEMAETSVSTEDAVESSGSNEDDTEV